MAYCGPHAVPYTDWLHWSDLDRAAAIAWQARDADRCPGCGLHAADVDGLAHWQLPVKGAYRKCAGCQAKEMTSGRPEGDEARWWHFRWAPRRRRSGTASRPSAQSGGRYGG